MIIRPESPSDSAVIRRLIGEAFDGVPHSDGSEPAIVDRLRDEGALTHSLVAVNEDEVVGHLAVSPVSFSQTGAQWYGLGPVAVLPPRQRTGIGSKLIERALRLLEESNAAGCCVLGDPKYYSRFGFTAEPDATFPGVESKYFQILSFKGARPSGTVTYHSAFYGGPSEAT